MKIIPQPLRFIGDVVSYTVRDAGGNSLGVVELHWVRSTVFQVWVRKGTGPVPPVHEVMPFGSEDTARMFARASVIQLKLAE